MLAGSIFVWMHYVYIVDCALCSVYAVPASDRFILRFPELDLFSTFTFVLFNSIFSHLFVWTIEFARLVASRDIVSYHELNTFCTHIPAIDSSFKTKNIHKFSNEFIHSLCGKGRIHICILYINWKI